VKEIAFFVGANTHFNVTRVIANHGWMLSEEFDLHLITTEPNAYMPTAADYYSICGEKLPSNRFGHAASLLSYMRNYSPDIVIPVTRPVIYGSIVSPFALSSGTEYIYRHSGEVFNYYRVLQGWKKALCFGVRNIGGVVPLSVAGRCIALGPNGKETLVSRGVDPGKITILPPTIASDRFENNRSSPPEQLAGINRDIILFIGRRTRVKGINIMEEVIPATLKKRKNLQFVFVGGGNQIPVVPNFAKDHLTIVGAVSPPEVTSYLSLADLLVLPSLSEGVPRVLLEALYMDTPVLASRVGDIPHVTDNIFDSIDEFVRNLINYEDLKVDSVDPFQRSYAKEAYINFFKQYPSNDSESTSMK